jgi:hypothetical protein
VGGRKCSPTVILGIETDDVFQIMWLRIIMIPWLTTVDPEDGSHEYKARLAGIDFYIWRARLDLDLASRHVANCRMVLASS